MISSCTRIAIVLYVPPCLTSKNISDKMLQKRKPYDDGWLLADSCDLSIMTGDSHHHCARTAIVLNFATWPTQSDLICILFLSPIRVLYCILYRIAHKETATRSIFVFLSESRKQLQFLE